MWNAGYVSEVDYIYGYFYELAPVRRKLALLSLGISPDVGDRPNYLTIGCGQGCGEWPYGTLCLWWCDLPVLIVRGLAWVTPVGGALMARPPVFGSIERGNAVYVSEVDYIYGYFSELAPVRLKLALLSRGISHDVGDRPNYLELGFGQGLSLNINAATSSGQFFGTDFNPSQAAYAAQVARAGGKALRIFDDSFEDFARRDDLRSEEHTSELQSLMRISYAVFCL